MHLTSHFVLVQPKGKRKNNTTLFTNGVIRDRNLDQLSFFPKKRLPYHFCRDIFQWPSHIQHRFYNHKERNLFHGCLLDRAGCIEDRWSLKLLFLKMIFLVFQPSGHLHIPLILLHEPPLQLQVNAQFCPNLSSSHCSLQLNFTSSVSLLQIALF